MEVGGGLSGGLGWRDAALLVWLGVGGAPLAVRREGGVVERCGGAEWDCRGRGCGGKDRRGEGATGGECVGRSACISEDTRTREGCGNQGARCGGAWGIGARSGKRRGGGTRDPAHPLDNLLDSRRSWRGEVPQFLLLQLMRDGLPVRGLGDFASAARVTCAKLVGQKSELRLGGPPLCGAGGVECLSIAAPTRAWSRFVKSDLHVISVVHVARKRRSPPSRALFAG